MKEHSEDALNRRELIKSVVAVTVAVPAIMAADEEVAAAHANIDTTGVAEVIDQSNSGLIVRLLDGGRFLHLPAKDFGDMPINRGDLVAVMPNQPSSTNHRDSISVYPFLQAQSDRIAWRFDSAGNTYPVRSRS